MKLPPVRLAALMQRLRAPSLRIAVVAMLVLYGAGWAQLRTNRLANRAQSSDAATILALAGVRDFAQQADPGALMRIPMGADSMVMKARVFAGDESMGSYAVRVSHIGPSDFRLRSTGRLTKGASSMTCNLDVFVQLSTDNERPSMGVEQEPLCNGLRHESAVTRVRNIGS